MNNPEQPQNNEEEIREIDGKKYRRIDTGYTLRNFFSHEGPGWDTRWSVLQQYGVVDPSELPDTPFYKWDEIIEENTDVSINETEILVGLSDEQQDAIDYINMILGDTAVLGFNDSELWDMNQLIKGVRNGTLDPVEARAVAFKIQVNKQNYH